MAPNRPAHEATLVTLAIGAIAAVISAAIQVLPNLHKAWQIAIAVIIAALILVPAAFYLIGRIRAAVVANATDLEVVGYTDDRERGILRKGDVENVSLRIETIQALIGDLADALPSEEARRNVLYRAGMDAGHSWASEFRRQLPRLDIAVAEVPLQLLKWGDYDATAGMGRLMVAVNPLTASGTVLLSNGFLTRRTNRPHLDWWFAGYIAGTLNQLLGQDVRVTLGDSTRDVRVFDVKPETGSDG